MTSRFFILYFAFISDGMLYPRIATFFPSQKIKAQAQSQSSPLSPAPLPCIDDQVTMQSYNQCIKLKEAKACLLAGKQIEQSTQNLKINPKTPFNPLDSCYDRAKRYYELACSFNQGEACKWCALHTEGPSQTPFFQKACQYGDIESCITIGQIKRACTSLQHGPSCLTLFEQASSRSTEKESYGKQACALGEPIACAKLGLEAARHNQEQAQTLLLKSCALSKEPEKNTGVGKRASSNKQVPWHSYGCIALAKFSFSQKPANILLGFRALQKACPEEKILPRHGLTDHTPAKDAKNQKNVFVPKIENHPLDQNGFFQKQEIPYQENGIFYDFGEACFELGNLFYQGFSSPDISAPSSLEKATTLWEKACFHLDTYQTYSTHPSACYALGMMALRKQQQAATWNPRILFQRACPLLHTFDKKNEANQQKSPFVCGCYQLRLLFQQGKISAAEVKASLYPSLEQEESEKTEEQVKQLLQFFIPWAKQQIPSGKTIEQVCSFNYQD